MSDDSRKISPWIPGIIDTMVGAKIIADSTISHRNRLAVILLDTALETACRAFLRYKKRIKLSEAHKHRDNLISTVKTHAKDIDEEVWKVLDFNYEEIRCDFYHETASKTITDEHFLDYKESIEFVIDRLLDIKSSQMVQSQILAIGRSKQEIQVDPNRVDLPSIHDVEEKTDKIIIAIATINPKTVHEINAFFKKEGDSLRLSSGEFTNILARNRGTRNYFYYDKQTKNWQLSGLGMFRINQLKEEEPE